MSDRALPPVLRETSDVRFRSMLALLALIGGTLFLLMGVAWLIFPRQVADRRFAPPFPHYPAPNLQISPREDMASFKAREMQQLNSAGWLDAAHTRLHIPIDQAMRHLARTGIPGWPASKPVPQDASR